MNESPYNRACRLIDDFKRDFEVIGDAIADPLKRLEYYAAIAMNTEPERQMEAIRKRADRIASEMIGYKPKRMRRRR